MDSTLKQLTAGKGRKGGKKGKRPRKPRVAGPEKTKRRKAARVAKAKRNSTSRWRSVDGSKSGRGRIERAAYRENVGRIVAQLAQAIQAIPEGISKATEAEK